MTRETEERRRAVVNGRVAAEAPDSARIERAVRELLEAMGENPEREGLRDTPARIARMYGEIFAGLYLDPADYLRTQFDEGHDEMVILRDIPFYSVCEHHLVPFHGVAHVGYIPDGKVVGLSKLARVVDGFAKRPQLQERLTAQIADAIMLALNPDGVAVVIECEHLCLTMRGIKKAGSKMVTSAVRGLFKRSAVTRQEFFSLVKGG
ncbi:MAG: GTP cyclohydrolase I FolE [Chloroflexi bacterium]|nr:GTP cyclohydrolase I FolE [Chloroflexota bacterium]